VAEKFCLAIKFCEKSTSPKISVKFSTFPWIIFCGAKIKKHSKLGGERGILDFLWIPVPLKKLE